MALDVKTGPLVEVSSDGLRVTVRGNPCETPLDDLKHAIVVQMRDLRLAEDAFELDLEKFLLDWMESGESGSPRLLFEGTHPTPPVHGELVWARDFFASGFERDQKSDRIDYRAVVDQRGVSSGELLCTITEAIDGIPGRDVFGKPIRAARAKRARISVGPNVATTDNLRFTATCDGRISWRKGKLSVDAVYVIEQSVSLKTGHINHPGTLVVQKDIEPGSRVVAEKDIDVQGMIESATVEAGGEITVRGGIVGRGENRVTAGGKIRASYLLESNLVSRADVVVAREIVQSQVHALGCVLIPDGRITGGNVQSGTQIVVGELGTDGAVKTRVAICEPGEIAAERQYLESKADGIRSDRLRIAPVVEVLEAQRSNLPADKLCALNALTVQLDKLLYQEQECKEALDEFAAKYGGGDARTVRILRRVHPEVTICIGRDSKRITRTIDGPLTARAINGEIRLVAD